MSDDKQPGAGGSLWTDAEVDAYAAHVRAEAEVKIALLEAQIRTMRITYGRDDLVGKAVELHAQSKQYVEHAQQREARIAELEAQLRELRKRVQVAIDYAGGRWSEWGERAEHVAELLDEALTPQSPERTA